MRRIASISRFWNFPAHNLPLNFGSPKKRACPSDWVNFHFQKQRRTSLLGPHLAAPLRMNIRDLWSGDHFEIYASRSNPNMAEFCWLSRIVIMMCAVQPPCLSVSYRRASLPFGFFCLLSWRKTTTSGGLSEGSLWFEVILDTVQVS